MNKTLPIILLIVAGIVISFLIVTQTPVSKHIPVINKIVQQSQNSEDNSPNSPGASNTDQVISRSSGSGGSGGSGSSGGDSTSPSENNSQDIKAPNYCTSESREIETCEGVESHIICGWYYSNIQCSIGPCVRMFGNDCEACRDSTIEYWTEGECPIHG